MAFNYHAALVLVFAIDALLSHPWTSASSSLTHTRAGAMPCSQDPSSCERCLDLKAIQI